MVVAAATVPARDRRSPEMARSAKFWIIKTCCGVPQGFACDRRALLRLDGDYGGPQVLRFDMALMPFV